MKSIAAFLVLALIWFAGLLAFSVYLLVNAIEARSSEVIYAGLAVIVFSFFSIRVLIRLLPGHASLALDVSGFEVRNAYERTFWLWRNVSNFRVEVPSDERLPDRARPLKAECRPSGQGFVPSSPALRRVQSGRPDKCEHHGRMRCARICLGGRGGIRWAPRTVVDRGLPHRSSPVRWYRLAHRCRRSWWGAAPCGNSI